MSLPRGVGGFESLNALDLLLQLLTGQRAQQHAQTTRSHIDQGFEQGREIAQEMGGQQNPDPFRAAYELGAGTRPEPEGMGWGEAVDYLDLFDDLGIAGQRRISGELGHDSGILETIMREAQSALMEGRGYQSPFRYEAVGEFDDDLTDHGYRPAGLGERVLGGLMTPYGGAADLTNLGIRGVRGIANIAQKGFDGVMSLAAGARGQPHLRVYHGTDASPFSAFETGHSRTAQHFYASPIREDAAQYGRNIVEADVIGRVGGFMPEDRGPEAYQALRRAYADGGLAEHFRSFDDFVDAFDAGDMYQRFGSQHVQNDVMGALFEQGYDALRIPDAGFGGAISESVVARDPSVLRVVTGGGDEALGLAAGARHLDDAAGVTDDLAGLAQDLAPGARHATSVDDLAHEAVRNRQPELAGLHNVVRRFRDAVDSGVDMFRAAPTPKKKVQAETLQKWGIDRIDNLTPEQIRTIADDVNAGAAIEAANSTIRIPDGGTATVNGWYDLQPLRDRFRHVLGEEQGDTMFAAYVSIFAVTSPLTKVNEHAQVAIALLDHLMSGRHIDEIVNMSKEAFGTISPGKAAFHTGLRRSGDQWVRGVTQAGDPRMGGLDRLLTNGRIDSQKVNSFYQNLMGNYTPLTVDSHNIRQLIGSLGYDAANPAARREIAKAFGVESTSGLSDFLKEGATVTIQTKRGPKVLKTSRDINIAMSSAIYAQITSDVRYGAVENIQGVLRERLIRDGLIPDMTPAEFQARLWTGGSRHSQVAAGSEAPAAQIIFDHLENYRSHRGLESLDDTIRQLWSGGEEATNVLVNAVYEAGGYAQAGISPEEFRNILRDTRGLRGRPGGDEDDDEQDMLGMMMGLFGGQ